jgi:hypothetical protein
METQRSVSTATGFTTRDLRRSPSTLRTGSVGHSNDHAGAIERQDCPVQHVAAQDRFIDEADHPRKHSKLSKLDRSGVYRCTLLRATDARQPDEIDLRRPS